LGETMRGHVGVAGGFCAFLRLRQGASARATWILEESGGGTMISVGSDDACDWQIRAAFVPPRAFSLLIVGGRVFVRSGPEPGVLLDGKQVEEGWVQVPHGARLDFGLARLEVTMGYGDTSGQLVERIEQVEESSRRTVSEVQELATAHAKHVGRTTLNLGAIPIMPIAPQQDVDDLAATTERPAVRMPRKKPHPTIELQLDDIVVEPSLADTLRASGVVPQARLVEHESGEFDVPADDTQARLDERIRAAAEFQARMHSEFASPEEFTPPSGAPALLDDEPALAQAGRRWWMYAAAGVATAGAYGGWLLLLDRI